MESPGFDRICTGGVLLQICKYYLDVLCCPYSNSVSQRFTFSSRSTFQLPHPFYQAFHLMLKPIPVDFCQVMILLLVLYDLP